MCRQTFKEPGVSGVPDRVMHHVMKISYEAPGEILSSLVFSLKTTTGITTLIPTKQRLNTKESDENSAGSLYYFNR